jgi:hypothetical protein
MSKTTSYKNGKIYKITNPNNEKYYIGSTVLDLDKRFKQHKYSKTRHDKTKLGGSSFKGKVSSKLASYDLVDGGCIELIEDCPCKSRAQLQRREGALIRDNKDKITNYFVAGVSLHDFFKAYGVLKKLKKI